MLESSSCHLEVLIHHKQVLAVWGKICRCSLELYLPETPALSCPQLTLPYVWAAATGLHAGTPIPPTALWNPHLHGQWCVLQLGAKGHGKVAAPPWTGSGRVEEQGLLMGSGSAIHFLGHHPGMWALNQPAWGCGCPHCLAVLRT